MQSVPFVGSWARAKENLLAPLALALIITGCESSPTFGGGSGDGDGDGDIRGDGDGDLSLGGSHSGDGDGDETSSGICGNGVLEDDELCDDGNLQDGDGCASDCGCIEDGYRCHPRLSCTYVGFCGDGLVSLMPF
jgi:cysteine-rich repeat protein